MFKKWLHNDSNSPPADTSDDEAIYRYQKKRSESPGTGGLWHPLQYVPKSEFTIFGLTSCLRLKIGDEILEWGAGIPDNCPPQLRLEAMRLLGLGYRRMVEIRQLKKDLESAEAQKLMVRAELELVEARLGEMNPPARQETTNG